MSSNEEEKGGRKGGGWGVIHSLSARSRPKGKIRRAAGRNGGARGPSASGRMQLGFYADDRRDSALRQPKGEIRLSVGRPRNICAIK